MSTEATVGTPMEIRTVLLVDDEDDIRTVGSLSLEQVGQWKVLLASSGEEALEKAAHAKPDLILLDVMMPGMDGPETLAKLRSAEASAGIPVIFMTAKVQRHEVARYNELGAAGVIAKPFDPMTLPDEIRRIASTS